MSLELVPPDPPPSVAAQIAAQTCPMCKARLGALAAACCPCMDAKPTDALEEEW